MRQKVVIRAVISQSDRILLLKRFSGRLSIAGKYELPGGSLHADEQPIDALKRSLQIHTAIYPESVKLRDTVSFIDPDNKDLQYLFVVYAVGLADGSPRITLSDEYSSYVWKKPADILSDNITNSTATILDVQNFYLSNNLASDYEIYASNRSAVVIYSDGGSRGNPGPSASAYIIMDRKDNILAQGGEYLGRSDSGMAEYHAVELAIDRATKLKLDDIEFRSDSLMVVNQLNGIFSVKNPEFSRIHDRIIRKIRAFRRVRFKHVHREYNRLADGLVNKVLDENE